MVEIIVANDLIVKGLPQKFWKPITDELTITNPDYVKKLRMGFWVGNTPKELSLFVVNQNNLHLPFGYLSSLEDYLQNQQLEYEKTYTHKKRRISPLRHGSIKPRDYQENAIQSILSVNNGILVSPCGSGKTIIGLELIDRLKCKTLWITHTLDLVKQSMNRCKEMYENEVGLIAGGKVNIQDITFATVQTLVNLDLGQLRDEFELVIVDEAHKCMGTPNRVMMFYKVITNLNAKHKYGLTATLKETKNTLDYTPIYLIGEKLHEIKKEDIERINAEHVVVELDTLPSDFYLKYDRTLDYHKLVDYLVFNQERNDHIINNLVKYKDRHNLILSIRNKHIEMLATELELMGYSVRTVIGSVSKEDREKILDEFREGKVQYLFSNYQLAKEGLDLPIADTLHLVFPIRDKVSLIQAKGRIERLYEGKNDAYVIDYLDANIGYLLGIYKQRRRVLR